MVHKIEKLIVRVLAFILLWMPIQANAYEWTNGDVKYTFTVANDEATITRVEILESDIIGGVNIPSSIPVVRTVGFDTITTWYPVKSFAGRSIGGLYSCTGVAIENGIVAIGADAFKGYGKFTHVVFPASIKRVGKDAFAGCGELGVIDIEAEALAAWCDIDFANAGANPLTCTKKGLAWIDRSIYVNGYPVLRPYKDMTIPDGISEIKQYAFCGHKSLETIEFPWSCEKIGTCAFLGCSSLTSLALTKNVTSIGDGAFRGCSGLRTLTMNSNVTNIGAGAFQNCGLYTVSLGSGMTSVSSNLFQGCTSLLDVDLGENVKTIGSHAFENCRSLTNVVFPSGLTSIGDHAFYKSRVGNGITGGYRGIELPKTVTNIGSEAFRECRGMYYFIIPTSVKTLGTDITKNCDNLINIIGPRRFKTYFQICNPTSFYTYNDVNVTFDANGGEVDTESMLVDIYSHVDELPVPLRWNHKFLGWFTATEGGEQVTSSTSMTKDMTLYARWEAVEYEWSYEENDDGGITITGASPNEGNMEIPSEIDGKVVTAIGYEAFHSADALTGVKFPDGVKEIGQSAFWKCSRLSRLEFTEGLEYIGHSAFSYCWNIEEIKIPSSVKEVDAQAFYGTSATNIVLLEGIQRIGATAIPAHNVSSLVIPSSVSILGDGWEYDSCPIYGCDNLSVATGNTVFKMEDGLLLSMDGTRLISVNAGKTAISIPASVTSIDEGAFACYDWWNNEGGMFDFETIPGICLADGWMVGYRSDDVPLDLDLTHIRGIQALALMSCPAKTIKLPSRLVRIDGSCFIWCSNLQSVEIPASCVEIGKSAFGGCENLRDVVIPQNVTNVSSGAFWNCDNLQTVVAPKSLDMETSQFDTTTSVYYYEGEPPTTLSFATIVLDVTGGDILTNNVKRVIKCEVGVLPIPVKAGNLFLGWYTAAEGGEEVTAETVVTGDMTLYAHWEESPFSATGGDAEWGGDSDGSWRSGAITDSQTTWAEMTVSGPCLVSFKWKTSSESNYDWLTFYVDGEQKDQISGVMDVWADYSLVIADAGSHTLRWSYSKDGSVFNGEDCGWVKDFAAAPVATYTVTLDANGGMIDGEAIAEVVVAEGSIVRTLPAPAMNGYSFIGWFTAAEGGDEVTAETVVTGDMTLYAHWGEIVYTYNYIDNGDGTVTLALYDRYDNWIGEPITPMPAGEITIPNEIDGKRVVGLSRDWIFYFAYTEVVTSVVVPAGVTNIVAGSLAGGGGSSNLTNITVAIDNPVYKSIDGIVYSKDGEELVLCPHGVTGTFQIPSGVRRISDSAFHECRYLEDVTFPATLESIGGYAFYGCSLKAIVIPGNVKEIGDSAFSNSYSLDDVVFEEGLEVIGAYAFWNNNRIAELNFPSSVRRIGSRAFGACYELLSVVYAGEPDDIDIAFDAFFETPYNSTLPFELVIDDEGAVVAFYGTIPENFFIVDYADNVVSIPGWGAFCNINGLSSIVIPGSVKSIGNGAFAYDELTNVTLSVGLESIGAQAFMSCSGLTSITIPYTVTYIDETAFQNCTALREIHMPLSLKEEFEGIVFADCAADVVWDFEPHFTVTFDVNGGTTIEGTEKLAFENRSIGNLPSPTRNGYVFIGWFTAAEGGDEVTAETVVTGDMTLYAHWIELSIDIATIAVNVGDKTVAVPRVWIEEHPVLLESAGSDAVAALNAMAANGRMSVAECYVLGLDPEEPNADLRIVSFPIGADGKPDLENLEFAPAQSEWNVPEARAVIMGAAELKGDWKAVEGATAAERTAMRFFKVAVELP